MYILNIFLRRKAILFIFFRHFVEVSAKNQPLLDYFWDISRDWESSKERQLNSAWEIDRNSSAVWVLIMVVRLLLSVGTNLQHSDLP